jgi:organizing structure protein 2
LTASLLVAGVALYPSTAHAEAPEKLSVRFALLSSSCLTRCSNAGTPPHCQTKKPIYDDAIYLPASGKPSIAAPFTTTTAAATQSAAPSSALAAPATAVTHRSRGPTPTERLAAEIRRARLFVYEQVCRAEDAVNAGMDRAFSLERSFTSTVASLAPPRESGERLMPGVVYVLVAAMAGSIVARRRGVLLRGVAPLAFGAGAAWAVLPVTTGNVGALLWTYEQRFPAVADAHVRAHDSVAQGLSFAKVHTQVAGRMVEEKVGDARDAVEGWVRKGK